MSYERQRVWFEHWRYVRANIYSRSATTVHLQVAPKASYYRLKQLTCRSSSHDPVMDIGLHSPSADKAMEECSNRQECR